MFLAKEYEKEGLWDQAFLLYIPVAWERKPSVMEIVAGCYAEAKDRKESGRGFLLGMNRHCKEGNPAMEDPVKTWMRKKNRRPVFFRTEAYSEAGCRSGSL